MAIQQLYTHTRTHPQTVGPNPKPLFFFSGVDIAECVKASLVTREYFTVLIKPFIDRPESLDIRKPKKRRKTKYKPFTPILSQNKWTGEEDKAIKKLYKDGLNYKQIAQEMNRSYSSVMCYIHRKIINCN